MGAKKGTTTGAKAKASKAAATAQEKKAGANSEKAAEQKTKEKKATKSKFSYQDDLANELSALGLRLKKIQADGNCFFRALSDQLQGDEGQHCQLRSQIMDYIHEHEDDFAPFVEDDEAFAKYVSRMRKDGVWAGNMELVAASHTLKVNITVYQAGQPRWTISNFDLGSVPMLHVSYHDGQHYNSVRMVEDPMNGAPMPIVIRGDGVIKRPAASSSDSAWGDKEIARVSTYTACTDHDLIRWALQEARGDPELAVEKVVERLAVMADNEPPDPTVTVIPTATVSDPHTLTASSSKAEVAVMAVNGQGSSLIPDRALEGVQGPGPVDVGDTSASYHMTGAEASLPAPDAHALSDADDAKGSDYGDDLEDNSVITDGRVTASSTVGAGVAEGEVKGGEGKRTVKGGVGVRVAGKASKEHASKVPSKAPSRNRNCPCGSKKKYKSCCGAAAAAAARRKAAEGGVIAVNESLSDEVVGRAAQLAAITI